MQSYREIKTDLQHLKAGAGTIVEKMKNRDGERPLPAILTAVPFLFVLFSAKRKTLFLPFCNGR